MFVIDHVNKSFGSKPILMDVSLEIDQGELAVISGSNGSGKTTLLKIAASLLSPDSGQVTVNTENNTTLKNIARMKKDISYVSHSSFLYENLTVTENLSLFSKLMEIDFQTSNASDLLHQFNISKYAGTKITDLSHGTKKKVSLCRGLIKTVRVMLWDEPDSGLDDSSMDTLSRIIRERMAAGVAVLLTSHNQHFVNSLGGASYGLDSGALRFMD